MSVLLESGIRARLADAGRTLTLVWGDATRSWTMRHFGRTPRPSEVDSFSSDIFWVPHVTPGLRTRLAELGISWVSDDGEVSIHAPWGLVAATAHDLNAGAVPPRAVKSLSAGASATLQFLLEHPTPATQHRLARAVGLSQPRVSQVLKELSRSGVAIRSALGWEVARPDRGFDDWLRAPHRDDFLTTFWFSLAPGRDQVAAVQHRAEAEHADIRLCGDWAADLVAPWRQPGQVSVHADKTLDLDSAGFVSSPAQGATLVLHVGPVRPDWKADQSVTTAMASQPIPLAIAPITEIAREIAESGGSDADQAVGELRAVWLRARAVVAQGGHDACR